MSDVALLVRFTNAADDEVFFLAADNVRMICRADEPPVSRISGEAKSTRPRYTRITTYMMLQTGLQAFEVKESVEEAGRLVNAARAGKDLTFS